MSTTIKPINKTFTAGKWMPRDRETLVNWMQKVMDKAEKDTGPLLPVVENLKNFIETDAKAYMFFNQMFDEVPADKKKTLLGLPQVRDYQHMLRLFNVILTHAPSFNETGFVGFPFNAILDWSMATTGRLGRVHQRQGQRPHQGDSGCVGNVPAFAGERLRPERPPAKRLVRGRRQKSAAEFRRRVRLRSVEAALRLQLMGSLLRA